MDLRKKKHGNFRYVSAFGFEFAHRNVFGFCCRNLVVLFLEYTFPMLRKKFEWKFKSITYVWQNVSTTLVNEYFLGDCKSINSNFHACICTFYQFWTLIISLLSSNLDAQFLNRLKKRSFDNCKQNLILSSLSVKSLKIDPMFEN